MGKRDGHRAVDEAGDPLKDASRGVRIQKALAAAGVDSRRRCEELIEQGLVRVNGRLVESLPAWVDPEADEIEVEGRRLPRAERHIYVMLNKPRRIVTTCDDPAGRRTVVDLVDHPSVRRLFPVGRLDYETSGLLLMTNDGELANTLTHPRYGVDKTYRATVKGRMTDDQARELARGLFLTDRKQGKTVGARRTSPAGVSVRHREKDKTVLEITLKEGRNRQVRRMLAQVGHPVVRLERVRMGPLKLTGLQRGAWRELTRDELRALRSASRAGVSSSRSSSGERLSTRRGRGRAG